MVTVTALREGSLSVYRYRCDAGPDDAPFAEVHPQHSLSIVLSGSFSCRCRGRSFEFVPGSVMVGHPGDEYICSHEHHSSGDECLSFAFTDDMADAIGGSQIWRTGGLAPHPQLMVIGELTQRAARGESDLGLAEAGFLFSAQFSALVSGRLIRPVIAARDRRRAVDAAHWIESYSACDIDLAAIAKRSGLSAFHFLRLFSTVIGVTPHQYLVRIRLRKAAGLLSDDDLSITEVALDVGFNDLSNFVRTFHRAAGLSPRRFRRLAKGDRKIVQERMTALGLGMVSN